MTIPLYACSDRGRQLCSASPPAAGWAGSARSPSAADASLPVRLRDDPPILPEVASLTSAAATSVPWRCLNSTCSARRVARSGLAAVAVPRDVDDGLVALILEPLDQGGDVEVEIGQLQRPLVGLGALDRRRDTEPAERDGGQGRDGDQQEEAGADAPVLQPMT